MRVRAPDGEKRRLALAVCRAAIVATGLGGGCGGPRIHVAPNDPEYEYRLGAAELQRRHWVAAEEHLKRFVDLHPGHARADSAQYGLGMAKLGARLYPEAAVEFQILGQEYPRSALRDDAAFQECVSYSKQLRSSQLDPTPAYRAKTCFQDYLLRFPGAPDSAAAVAKLAVIADYLAEKDFQLGSMFVRMKRPRVGRVYLTGLVQSYPGAARVPEALVYLGRAAEQDWQFSDAAAFYRRVLTEYPNSHSAPEASRRLAGLIERHPDLVPAPRDSSAP